MDAELKHKLEFGSKLISINKEDGLKYLKALFEEFKYKISDNDKYSILKFIVYIERNLFKFKDFDKYIKKTIMFAIRLGKDNDVLNLYKLYCKYLYRIGDFKKCASLSEEVILKLKSKITQSDLLVFKELQILSENSINFVRRIADQNENPVNIIVQENDILQLIETFIYYNLNFLFNENVIEIINNIKILMKSLRKDYKKYLKNNKVKAELNNFIGIVYLFFGYYNHAKRHFLLSLREGIQAGEHENILKYNNNIALVYAELGYIDKAMEYFSIIEKMYANINDERELTQSYAGLTLIYLRKKRYSLVKAISLKSLKRKKELGEFASLIFMLTKYISITYYENFDLSYEYYLELKKLFKNVNNTFYGLYRSVFEKIYEKKETLNEILINLVQRNFYPISLMFPLSLILDNFKDLEDNYFFRKIVLNFYDRTSKELSSKRIKNIFFDNHIELKKVYEFCKNLENFKEKPITKKQFDKVVEVIQKINSNSKIDNFSNEELLIYLFLKVSRVGYLQSDKFVLKYEVNCYHGNNTFQKQLYLRYNLAKIDYYIQKKENSD